MRTGWLTFHDRKWLTLKRPLTRSSNIYQQAGEFKEGECVFFSGIVSAEGDSMFESTTMSHPEYNIDFTALNKCN